jgi:hypothetical protein
MKLNRRMGLVTILHLHIIGLVWLTYLAHGIVVPLAVTVLLSIPWVIRKSGKLLKDAFDSCD